MQNKFIFLAMTLMTCAFVSGSGKSGGGSSAAIDVDTAQRMIGFDICIIQKVRQGITGSIADYNLRVAGSIYTFDTILAYLSPTGADYANKLQLSGTFILNILNVLVTKFGIQLTEAEKTTLSTSYTKSLALLREKIKSIQTQGLPQNKLELLNLMKIILAPRAVIVHSLRHNLTLEEFTELVNNGTCSISIDGKTYTIQL